MRVDIRRCTPGDNPELLGLLDQEFVFSRGRKLSLIERMPELFREGSPVTAHVVCADGAVGATATVRRFRWLTPQRDWQGAMVGLVYTRPGFRGQGLASKVMQALQDDLVQSEVDFGVLWTTIPAFYERFGWRGGDRGAFGEALPGAGRNPVKGVGARPLPEGDIPMLEAIRARWLPERVERSPWGYRAVPLPASSVELFYSDGGGEEGYALVGRSGSTGYVYEVVGPPPTQQRLWHAIAGSYEKTYLNESAGSPLSEWLEQLGLAAFQKQELAMWLPVSRASWGVTPGAWHIPFFDRI